MSLTPIRQLVLLVALTALGVSPTAVSAPISTAPTEVVTAEEQPNMYLALGALITAREYLERAKQNKGGHRAKALALTKKAIVQVGKGIHFDDVKHQGEAPVTMGRQRAMKRAKKALETAIGALERATADKGGHRVKAHALAKKAKKQVKKGIKFADKH